MPRTVNGIGRVWPKLRTQWLKTRRAGELAAEGGSQEVASAMRYLAPRDERDLIESIRVEEPDSPTFIGRIIKAGDETTIVTNSRGVRFQNAKIQEHGTKNMPANPFFNPAWRFNRQRVKGKITRAIRKAWSS